MMPLPDQVKRKVKAYEAKSMMKVPLQHRQNPPNPSIVSLGFWCCLTLW